MKKKSNILIKRRRTHGTGDTLSDDDPREVLPISMQTKNSFLPTTLWCSAFLVRQNKAYLQTTAIWFWKCKKNLIVITPSRGILHIKYIYIWLLMISFREVPGDWLRQTNLFTIVKFGIWTIKKFQILDTVSCYLRTLNNSDNRFWKTNHLLMLFHILWIFFSETRLKDLITKPQTQHSASCKTRN